MEPTPRESPEADDTEKRENLSPREEVATLEAAAEILSTPRDGTEVLSPKAKMGRTVFTTELVEVPLRRSSLTGKKRRSNSSVMFTGRDLGGLKEDGSGEAPRNTLAASARASI